LVRHDALFTAYADGTLAEQGEDREAYLSHYAFDSELQRYFAANRGSTEGFAGPCWCRWLVLDIDRDNLAEALADARRLVTFLRERYQADDVPVYFSGGKGFHVLVELAHNPPPAVTFPATARAFAEHIAAAAGVQIDRSIYDRNHIIRCPNTRHPRTGLHRRRIDADDLFQLDIDGIRRHAAHPAGDGLPTAEAPSAQLIDDWRQAEVAVRRQQESRAVIRQNFKPDIRAPRYFLDFLRFGVPVGERHMTLFRCAAWLTEQGAPPSLVAALLTEPGLDCGLPPKDAERQIHCGIEHAQKQLMADEPPLGVRGDCWEHPLDRLGTIDENELDFPYGANVAPNEGEMLI
jgi:hypothetical protein